MCVVCCFEIIGVHHTQYDQCLIFFNLNVCGLYQIKKKSLTVYKILVCVSHISGWQLDTYSLIYLSFTCVKCAQTQQRVQTHVETHLPTERIVSVNGPKKHALSK